MLLHKVSIVAAPGLWSTGSIVAQGLSCSAVCGLFPDQGSNLCLPYGGRILYH